MTQHDLIPPDKASLILKRAAEMDAQGASISLAELEAAAKEAGLDPLATATAIREVLADTLPAPDNRDGVTLAASATNGAAGLGLGIASASYLLGLPPALSLLGMSGALVFALFRILTRKDHQERATALFENLVTWTGFVAGATVLSGSAFPEVGAMGGILFLGTSLVAAFARRRPVPVSPQGPTSVATQADGHTEQIGAGKAFSDGA